VCDAVRAEGEVPVLVGGPACDPGKAEQAGATAHVTLDRLVEEIVSRGQA
jgi:hypothetical protein